MISMAWRAKTGSKPFSTMIRCMSARSQPRSTLVVIQSCQLAGRCVWPPAVALAPDGEIVFWLMVLIRAPDVRRCKPQPPGGHDAEGLPPLRGGSRTAD